MEFHNQQQAAMQRLQQDVLSCLPRHWRVAALELVVGGVPQMGLRSIRHRLHNPATAEEWRKSFGENEGMQARWSFS